MALIILSTLVLPSLQHDSKNQTPKTALNTERFDKIKDKINNIRFRLRSINPEIKEQTAIIRVVKNRINEQKFAVAAAYLQALRALKYKQVEENRQNLLTQVYEEKRNLEMILISLENEKEQELEGNIIDKIFDLNKISRDLKDVNTLQDKQNQPFLEILQILKILQDLQTIKTQRYTTAANLEIYIYCLKSVKAKKYKEALEIVGYLQNIEDKKITEDLEGLEKDLKAFPEKELPQEESKSLNPLVERNKKVQADLEEKIYSHITLQQNLKGSERKLTEEALNTLKDLKNILDGKQETLKKIQE